MKTVTGFGLVTVLWFAPGGVSRGAETVHNFDRWEKEIAAFEASDRTNAPPRGALLFTGSSTVRLWKSLAQDFPGHRTINRGFGGCQIVDCTHFADRIIVPYAPAVVFLRAGGNDLYVGKSAEQVFAEYCEFVAAVQAKLPEVEIVFIGLCPTIARWKQAERERALNGYVEAYARTRPRLKYVEIYDLSLDADGRPRPEVFVADQLHFNAEGYRLLAERVRPFLPK